MIYPIVQVKTDDGLWLHGLLLEAENVDTVFLHIHGTASNFYEEYFIEVMSKRFVPEGISMLSVNNRGAGVYDAWQGCGAAVEKFEDCLVDIDAWIVFALDKGYKKVILAGHSLGTEKVIYYMTHGKHRNVVSAVVLLAPADSYGSHRIDGGQHNTEARKRVDDLLASSAQLIEQGKGDTFLTRYAYGSHRGIMPKSAESFMNFLGSDSKVLEGLPLATGKLDNFRAIQIPILVVIGDGHEYTGLSIKDALELMKRENPLTEAYQIKDCDHDFQGKEEELTDLTIKFIQRSIR